MIITEYYMTRSDGVNLIRTYSDEDRKLIQNETGIMYSEAIDIEGSPYTYTESDEFIERLPEELMQLIEEYNTERFETEET